MYEPLENKGTTVLFDKEGFVCIYDTVSYSSPSNRELKMYKIHHGIEILDNILACREIIPQEDAIKIRLRAFYGDVMVVDFGTEPDGNLVFMSYLPLILINDLKAGLIQITNYEVAEDWLNKLCLTKCRRKAPCFSHGI